MTRHVRPIQVTAISVPKIHREDLKALARDSDPGVISRVFYCIMKKTMSKSMVVYAAALMLDVICYKIDSWILLLLNAVDV